MRGGAHNPRERLNFVELAKKLAGDSDGGEVDASALLVAIVRGVARNYLDVLERDENPDSVREESSAGRRRRASNKPARTVE